MYVEFSVEKRLGDFALRASGVFKPGVTCLVGPNGSGKTTLMKILADLLRPDAGYVKKVGVAASVYVGDFYAPPEAYGIDVVLAGRSRLSRRPVGRVDEEAAARYAEAFEASGFLKRRWGTLSGGQRQLLILAAALAAEADLTLVDEPLAGLYPERRAWALSVLKKVASGRIVVVSTHNFEVVKCCDYVVELDGGVVKWAGPGGLYEPPPAGGRCGVV